VLHRAFALSPDEVDALARAAAVTADLGDIEGATRLLVEGAARASRPALLHHLRGRMLLHGGDREGAETAWRTALEADRDFVPAYRDLGLLLAGHRPGEGAKLLEEAVARGIRDASVFFQLGWLAETRGRKKEAEEFYRMVLMDDPGDAATLNNLALLLSETPERRAEALTLARAARKAAPDQAAVADTLGQVLYLMERFDEAVEVLLEAAGGLPDRPEVLHHAGMACFRAYRWGEARDLLTRALKVDDAYPGAAVARETLAEMR
jgi:tetratricopeptide (TPR) repeat protein